HRLEVVEAVERRSIVDVVRAGDDHRPDLRGDEPLQLGGDALDGTLGLRVRVEEIAGDEDHVDLLDDRQIDRSLECGELPFALRGGLLAEIGMARAKMDVGGVEQSEHPVALPSSPSPGEAGWPQIACPSLAGGSGASEAPPGPRPPARLSAAIVTGRLSRSRA